MEQHIWYHKQPTPTFMGKNESSHIFGVSPQETNFGYITQDLRCQWCSSHSNATYSIINFACYIMSKAFITFPSLIPSHIIDLTKISGRIVRKTCVGWNIIIIPPNEPLHTFTSITVKKMKTQKGHLSVVQFSFKEALACLSFFYYCLSCDDNRNTSLLDGCTRKFWLLPDSVQPASSSESCILP